MPLVSGKNYVLYNHQGGTALDLDIGSQNVQGWTYLGKPNQQWKLTSRWNEGGEYWTIQNVQSGSFLTYKPPSKNGTRIICAFDSAATWTLSKEPGDKLVYRIKYGTLCVDLADGGKSADGTAVQLWVGTDGDNQKWEVQDA